MTLAEKVGRKLMLGNLERQKLPADLQKYDCFLQTYERSGPEYMHCLKFVSGQEEISFQITSYKQPQSLMHLLRIVKEPKYAAEVAEKVDIKLQILPIKCKNQDYCVQVISEQEYSSDEEAEMQFLDFGDSEVVEEENDSRGIQPSQHNKKCIRVELIKYLQDEENWGVSLKVLREMLSKKDLKVSEKVIKQQLNQICIPVDRRGYVLREDLRGDEVERVGRKRVKNQ